MKKLFLLLTAVIMAVVCALAQNRTITGVVVDAENNDPLVGATVMPVGSQNGVATDLEGQFTLTITSSVKEITVSYIGYTSTTVPVKDNMTIALKPESTMLDQVVVTGYGSAKKLGSVVGSVSVVSEEALSTTPSTNFVDALQGQVAGLGIFSNTGEPASTPSNIRIRGVNSLEASNTPLFILDGAPVSSSVFTSLNTNDIANVTVLKDASATAIYGSRAANGVIVITTKKGKLGEQAQVTVRAKLGWSSRVQSKTDMMDSYQYLRFREEQHEAFGVADLSQAEKDAINIYGISTDWQKVMMKDNVPTYSLEGAVQGGTEKTNYYLSLSHMDQEGLIAKSDFSRQALRANFDARIKDWFKIGFQANLGVEHYETNTTASYAGQFYINGPIVLSYMMLPYDSPYYYTVDANNKVTFGERANWYRYTNGGIADANYLNDLQSGRKSSVNVNAMIYEQLTPIKGLTLRAQQAVDGFDYRNTNISNATEDYITPMGDKTNFGSQYLENSRGEAFQRYYAFTYTNTAEYKFNIDNVHQVSALLGQESIISRSNAFGISTSGQPNHTQNLLTNGTTVTMDNVSHSMSEYVINSYFLQGDYSYDDRYFFNFSVRRDGSSKFADGHRWATFYALGAMWNMKNEKFLQPYKWLDDLKLRINYGTTGNSGIDPYQFVGAVGTGTAYKGESSLGLASQSNEDFTWETVKQLNVGVSYSVFNKLYGTVDFYVKNTHNMLMNIPYSGTTGWTSGMANIGSLRNTGVDVEIGTHLVQTKDWYVGVRANFNYNKNIVTELFNGKDEYNLTDYGMVYKIGEDPNQLNTVMFAGIDPQDGKQMWYDIDGNLTKQFNRERDAVNTGKSFVAPWTGGFGFDVQWKGLSLHTDFTWAADKYIFNWANQLIENPAYIYAMNQSVRMLDSWRYPGQVTNMPAITESIQADSRYLENSSYCRMKNLTLTYALPQNWVKKLDMSNIAFHFTGRNLLTFCSDSYTGNDPEYENNGVRFMYPNTRQYEFGIEVSF